MAGFLGGNNILSAKVVDGQFELFGVRAPRPARYDASKHETGSITIWIRPEDVHIGDAPSDAIRFETTVIDVSFIGSGERVAARSGDGQEITLLLPSTKAHGLAVGDTLVCHVSPSAIGFLAVE